MIVYYYYFGLQITSIGVTPSAWEIFSMTPLSSPSVTKRIASLVTAINVLIAGGFSIAGLMSPKSILPASSAPTDASFIFAMYAAARTIPLALMALIAIYKHSGTSVAHTGYTGGFHSIAGCRGWVVAA